MKVTSTIAGQQVTRPLSISKHPLAARWRTMFSRCYGKKRPSNEIYNTRNITICAEWHDFETFVNDVGLPPSDKPHLDRINGDKGYSPDNCRWASYMQNSANRRGHFNNIKYKGVQLTSSGRFKASIGAAGKPQYIGVFNTAEEAAIEYNKIATEWWGQFALLNKVDK